MAIKIKQDGNVAVLNVRGKLMGGPETEEVKEKLNLLVQEGVTLFVFDLSKVKWMNSSGVGMMMACYASVAKIEGKLGLAQVSKKAEDALSLTQVIRLFDQFGSVKEAVEVYRSKEG